MSSPSFSRPTSEPRSEWRTHWPVVCAAGFGVALATAPIYATQIVIGPLEKEFGWSRAAITSGPLIVSIVAVAGGPMVGLAVDRFGPRRIGIVGAVVGCMAIAALSAANASLASWWALWSIMALAALLVKPMVWTAGVASLFTATRGLALAMSLCGTAVAATVTPLLTSKLVGAFGWRGGFIGLALIWGIAALPWIIFRFTSATDIHRKREAGAEAPVSRPAPSGIAVRKALFSWRFLQLSLAGLLMTLTGGAFAVSLVPILISSGQTPGNAAAQSALIGVTNIIGRISGGYLLDRMNANIVAACSVTLPIASALLLLTSHGSSVFTILAVLALGLSLGAELDAITFLTARNFGLRNFGVLYGTIGGLSALATGLGPVLVNASYDLRKSYDLGLWMVIPMSLAAGVLLLTLGRPLKYEDDNLAPLDALTDAQPA